MSSAYTIASDVAAFAGAALVTAGAFRKAQPFATSLGDDNADDSLCAPEFKASPDKLQALIIDTGKKDPNVTVKEISSPMTPPAVEFKGPSPFVPMAA